MKKLILVIGLALAALVPTCVLAQEAKIYDFPPLSAVANTPALNLVNPYKISAYQSVSVTLGAGTNSACSWQVQSSDDLGTTWINVGTSQVCTAPLYYPLPEGPIRWIRVSLTAYTGTAPVTFHWTGSH